MFYILVKLKNKFRNEGKNFLNSNFDIFLKINNSQIGDVSSLPVLKDLTAIN